MQSVLDYIISIAYLLVIFILVVKLTKFISNKYMSEVVIDNSKIIVITGCDSGIGLELAKHVTEWGFYLVACCLDLDSKGAVYLRNRNVDVQKLNVLEENSVLQLRAKMFDLHAQKKELYCLVNNAGVLTLAPTEWHTWRQIEDLLMINLSGTIQVTRLLLPFLRQSKGRVVNVCSPKGIIASPLVTSYCSSKAGVEAFTHALRREVSKYGVQVTYVIPGDLSDQTTIMRSNDNHLESMWLNMTEEAKSEFQDEYKVMKQKLGSAFQHAGESCIIKDDYLANSFKMAITYSTPAYSYVAGPLTLRILLFVIQLLPVSVTDLLIKYNIPDRIIRNSRSQI